MEYNHKHNTTLEKLEIIYYFTQVPVSLYSNNSPVVQFPEKPLSMDALLKNECEFPNIIFSRNQTFTCQFITNDYYECFIVYELNDTDVIIIGPFLDEEMYDAKLSTLIKKNTLSIKLKHKLMDYFSKLQILDHTKRFYINKLLNYLFPDDSSIHLEQNTSTDTSEKTSVPENYFVTTYKNRLSMFEHPPYYLEQVIVKHIKNGIKPNARHILSEINSLNRAKLSDDPLRSLKNSLIGSCTIFTRAAIAGGVTDYEAFNLSDAFIMEIEKTNSMSELNNLEYRMVETFIEKVNEAKTFKFSPIIKNTMLYIVNHLSDKLTLKDIADHVYVHPNYLSALFKKEVGISLFQYIIKKRIEESTYFLKYSNESIADIAAFYQFCNQSYYIKMFHKYMGMSPNAYRQSNN
ncbi:MAG: two-component system, response regulator YesN [Epulopiscium sp.]|jgi:YesN/AraC family two-component response regulator|uniref:AraC family transcriptional regulator n=1 Tax=Defluviitalea raffinosedens TaxID=1450156 RepID=A0A7C8LG10_9FIRM|nr:AraC family transcriptional regulator [Defluviitalea raffinosedens]MBZ4667396.1 transcriptional regulator, AraC family [Defluviitaleaceae bacterium]MDK2787760.1 two-component system, response regulator YesN [Candidatus Epulonipiscium sp.]KAE9632025.1 AraC family transcriptional regulator [Defluviitalea raffinosedens]MBM7686473.1 YesN/AraC family two-component response regulator [Defluviitalea raffinosedens]HHW66388.1 AraC family transcriptional regulator [Candidatus Epulonipiscium sp.]